MYVCELTTQFSETGPPAPGRVLRVRPGGATEVVADSLATPNGIAFDPAGDLFVTVMSTGPTAGAPNGMVMRYDGVAAVAAPSPAPVPSPSPAPMPGLPNTGGGGGATGAWIVPFVAFAALALAALGAGLAARRRRQPRER